MACDASCDQFTYRLTATLATRKLPTPAPARCRPVIPLKYILRSLRARWVTSAMTVFGTALVVWASVLAFGLAAGLDHTLEVSGDPLDLVVMRKGATAETNSIIDESLARQIAPLADIATDPQGNRLCSPELVVVVNTQRRAGAGSANLILRGITPVARGMRPNLRILAGREPKPGLREAMTSRTIAQRFEGAALGETLDVNGNPFQIVGIFAAGDSAAESEVWTDLETLAQATQRGAVLSSVQLRAANDIAMQKLINRISEDEQFGLKAMTEIQYFADQATAGVAIKVVGRAIALFLSIGAMFAVANTMFGAVASRAREIGTLRALGFGRANILAAFLLESLCLALIGGILGCLGTLPLNGLSTGTANWATFSEITFAFRFGPAVLFNALVMSVAMGLFGGILPALRAVRMTIVNALREV